jgi:hypothetical protein
MNFSKIRFVNFLNSVGGSSRQAVEPGFVLDDSRETIDREREDVQL